MPSQAFTPVLWARAVVAPAGVTRPRPALRAPSVAGGSRNWSALVGTKAQTRLRDTWLPLAFTCVSVFEPWPWLNPTSLLLSRWERRRGQRILCCCCHLSLMLSPLPAWRTYFLFSPRFSGASALFDGVLDEIALAGCTYVRGAS